MPEQSRQESLANEGHRKQSRDETGRDEKRREEKRRMSVAQKEKLVLLHFNVLEVH